MINAKEYKRACNKMKTQHLFVSGLMSLRTMKNLKLHMAATVCFPPGHFMMHKKHCDVDQ